MILCPATRLQLYKQNRVRNVVAHKDNYFSRLVPVNVLAVVDNNKAVVQRAVNSEAKFAAHVRTWLLFKAKKQTIIFNARARSMHEK